MQLQDIKWTLQDSVIWQKCCGANQNPFGCDSLEKARISFQIKLMRNIMRENIHTALGCKHINILDVIHDSTCFNFIMGLVGVKLLIIMYVSPKADEGKNH